MSDPLQGYGEKLWQLLPDAVKGSPSLIYGQVIRNRFVVNRKLSVEDAAATAHYEIVQYADALTKSLRSAGCTIARREDIKTVRTHDGFEFDIKLHTRKKGN